MQEVGSVVEEKQAKAGQPETQGGASKPRKSLEK